MHLNLESSSAVIDPTRYKWYTYTGKLSHTLKNKNSQIAKIVKGSLWGMRNLNNRLDRVVTQAVPNAVFSLKVEFVDELIDDSVLFKKEVKVEAPPRKKRVVQVKLRPTPPPTPLKPLKPVKPPKSTKVAPKLAGKKPERIVVDPDDTLLDLEDTEDHDTQSFLSSYVRKT